MSYSDIKTKVIAKAQTDPAFRKALLNNPKSAIEKAFGAAPREDLEIKVVEETADTLYLVLPAAEGELSEAELEAVAGGKSTPLPIVGGPPA